MSHDPLLQVVIRGRFKGLKKEERAIYGGGIENIRFKKGKAFSSSPEGEKGPQKYLLGEFP